MFSVYNQKQGTFHAGVGFTDNPAAVYRYTQKEAEKVVKDLQGESDANGELAIVSYSFVFDILGTPGNRKKR